RPSSSTKTASLPTWTTSASSVSPMRGLRLRRGAWPAGPDFSNRAANDSSGRSELMAGVCTTRRPPGPLVSCCLEIEAGAAGDDHAAEVEADAGVRCDVEPESPPPSKASRANDRVRMGPTSNRTRHRCTLRRAHHFEVMGSLLKHGCTANKLA